MLKKIAFILILAAFSSSCGYLNSELYRKQTDALYRQGVGLYKAKKYEEAKKAFTELLSKDAGHYEGAFALGAACYALGQYKEARESFEKAAAINSADEVKTWLIETLLKLGEKDIADKIASTLPAEKGKAFADKIANAVPVLEAAERLDPRDDKILNKAIEFIRKDLYADARKALSKVLKNNPDKVQVNVVALTIEAGAGDYNIANETARKILAASAGEIHLDNFNSEDKKLILSKIGNIDPIKALEETNLVTGLILSQNLEDPQKGAEYIKQFLKTTKPEDLDVFILSRIGDALWRAQKVEPAVKIYELSLKKNANQPELITHLANIHRYRLGNPAKADELQKGLVPTSQPRK